MSSSLAGGRPLERFLEMTTFRRADGRKVSPSESPSGQPSRGRRDGARRGGRALGPRRAWRQGADQRRAGPRRRRRRVYLNRQSPRLRGFRRRTPGLDGATYPPQDSFRVSSQLTLPYPKDLPPAGAKSSRVAAVSSPVPGDLLAPGVHVRPGQFPSRTGVAVPEAAVHEDDHLLTPPCEVRFARYGAEMPSPPGYAMVLEQGQELQFRRLVAAPANPGHEFGTRQTSERGHLGTRSAHPGRHATARRRA